MIRMKIDVGVVSDGVIFGKKNVNIIRCPNS